MTEALDGLPLVGRMREVGIARWAYERATVGRPEVVVVSGISGMGKTRLIEEILAWAQVDGADVLRGQAYEPEVDLPYAPLINALRPRLEAENAPDDLLSDIWLSQLAHLLPELRERYPDLPTAFVDPTVNPDRLVEAVTRLVLALAERKLVVLAIDDIHWSNAATRSLLHYAIHRCAVAGARVLMMISVRSDIVEMHRELRQWLGSLEREATVTQLELGAIARSDIVRLVGLLTGSEEREETSEAARRATEFGEWLARQTGGEPDRIQQTLRSLVEHGVLGLRRAADNRTVLALPDTLDPSGPVPQAAPAVDSQPTYFPAHLHSQPTLCIGRDRELAAIQRMLLNDGVRLVNLIGPAGVGKSRLAIEVATKIGDQFDQGVYFIDMTPVRDPDLLSSTLAHGVGLQDTESGSLPQRLEGYLHDRRALLILDNLDQVVSGAPQVADLLESCPAITFLVTSREPLHLLWEHSIHVPPLALPDSQLDMSLGELRQFPSVALFLDRAMAINPDFSLNEDNARAVTELCTHLDGLPLALELVAARARLLSPQMMLKRLENRFSLLRWRAQDLPARQQTLRSAIDWSYDLLTEPEQQLFRHIAVFVGGFTLESVEALEASVLNAGVGDHAGESPTRRAGDLDVLDGMTSLVDKSLVFAEPEAQDEVRYRMLESIREYALTQLSAQSERDAVGRAHATYYLELAEEAEPFLRRSEQRDWFVRLEREHENLRAAQSWLIAHGQAEETLRLAASLAYFWWTRGYLAEGRRRLEEALACAQGVAPGLRAKCLNALAVNLLSQGEQERPLTILEEAHVLAQSVDDRWQIVQSLANLGLLAQRQGRWEESARLLTESQTYSNELGDPDGTAYALVHLGITALFRGDVGLAAQYLGAAEADYQAIGDTRNAVQTRVWLGYLAGMRGNVAEAVDTVEPSILECARMHDPRLLFHCATLVIWLAADEGSAELLAQLIGAQRALHARTGFVQSASIQTQSCEAATTARSRLSAAAFQAQAATGASLDFQQVADVATRVLQSILLGASTTAERP